MVSGLYEFYMDYGKEVILEYAFLFDALYCKTTNST